MSSRCRDEVDDLQWLELDQAADALTYERDRELSGRTRYHRSGRLGLTGASRRPPWRFVKGEIHRIAMPL